MRRLEGWSRRQAGDDAARTPDGTDRQPRTDSALFAHIAYKPEGVATADLNDWAEQFGIEVGADALRNARRHSARLARVPKRRKVVRPWILPDWRALDLFVTGAEATAVVVYERR